MPACSNEVGVSKVCAELPLAALTGEGWGVGELGLVMLSGSGTAEVCVCGGGGFPSWLVGGEDWRGPASTNCLQ